MRKYYICNGCTPDKFYDTLEEAKKEVIRLENLEKNKYGNIFIAYREDIKEHKVIHELKWREIINKHNEVRYVLNYKIQNNITQKQRGAYTCIKYFDL